MRAMFDNIKVGDTVLTIDSVRTEWSACEYFWTAKKVTRVTKTQFVVDTKARFKKNGYFIGDGSYYNCARNIGDNHQGAILKDETKEKNALIKRVNYLNLYKNKLVEIKLSLNSESFFEACDLIEKLHKLTVEEVMK